MFYSIFFWIHVRWNCSTSFQISGCVFSTIYWVLWVGSCFLIEGCFCQWSSFFYHQNTLNELLTVKLVLFNWYLLSTFSRKSNYPLTSHCWVMEPTVWIFENSVSFDVDWISYNFKWINIETGCVVFNHSTVEKDSQISIDVIFFLFLWNKFD